MTFVKMCILFFSCAIIVGCSPKLAPYAPPPAPPALYLDEPALNAALRDAEPFLALELAEAYPQFASPRVRIILLETLVELGKYKEAYTVGEALLNLGDRPGKTPKYQKRPPKKAVNTEKTVKKMPKKMNFPQYLTKSQKYKVYFNLSLAYEGSNKPIKTREYFEKTAERPNYYYLYRYAQNRLAAGDEARALDLLKQSYERSNGKFSYINEAYARFLTQQAFIIYRKNPQEAKAKLALVLGNDQLKKCSAAARAEILWHQWF